MLLLAGFGLAPVLLEIMPNKSCDPVNISIIKFSVANTCREGGDNICVNILSISWERLAAPPVKVFRPPLRMNRY